MTPSISCSLNFKSLPSIVTVKIEKVLLYLKPNDFNFDVNKRIFACMVNLYTKRIPIEPIIVFSF
ncbi:DnaB-like helicase N-terminal domain-containing protein (plasmid) [Borreliella americana]|uniref:DnaB-like helicase N-terminal domain-containing protein n=1 Tax=Borreliella americana TaxID=478807 RepID=A0ACD5G5T7_9SPIR